MDTRTKAFTQILNLYFRCKRFNNIPQEFDLYGSKPSYEAPENINIYIIQHIKNGLNEDNIMLFINWYKIEQNKIDIDNWIIDSVDSGSIQTDFGIVSFQVDLVSEHIYVSIRSN